MVQFNQACQSIIFQSKILFDNIWTDHRESAHGIIVIREGNTGWFWNGFYQYLPVLTNASKFKYKNIMFLQVHSIYHNFFHFRFVGIYRWHCVAHAWSDSFTNCGQ